MIKKVNHRQRETASILLTLQILSYRVEAEFIDYDGLPPLSESVEDIMNTDETFIVYETEDRIAGFISYDAKDGVLTICKAVVHPHDFRKGIASRLLEYILQLDAKADKIQVSTAANNTPAIRLYQKYGFTEAAEIKINEKLSLQTFEKIR